MRRWGGTEAVFWGFFGPVSHIHRRKGVWDDETADEGFPPGAGVGRQRGGAALLLPQRGGGGAPRAGGLRRNHDPLPLSLFDSIGFFGAHPDRGAAGAPPGRADGPPVPVPQRAGPRHPDELGGGISRRGAGAGGDGGARGPLPRGRWLGPHLLCQQRPRLPGGGGGGGGVWLPQLGAVPVRLSAAGGGFSAAAPSACGRAKERGDISPPLPGLSRRFPPPPLECFPSVPLCWSFPPWRSS